jgi:hypothetical protein
VVNPADFMLQVYRFLGVDATVKSEYLEVKVNSASAKKYLAKSRAVWYLYRLMMRLRWFDAAGLLENINRNEYPPMRSDTKRWLLEDVYGEKNRCLEKLIGRDLSQWNQI